MKEMNWKWRKSKHSWHDCSFVGSPFRFSLCRLVVQVYWILRGTSSLTWLPARLLSLWWISLVNFNRIRSGDGFSTLCKCHGLADNCDSEECHRCIIGRNYDFCDSRWHHHLGGNENSGHFQVLIEKLSSRAIGEVEYDRWTVYQWSVANIHIFWSTSWPNKIRPLHPHWRQICLHISKIHCSMQWPWNQTWSSRPRISRDEWYMWSQMTQSPKTANILLKTAQLGGAFFNHTHAYTIHIVNSCPAKNVTDQDGNPTTTPWLPANTAIAENQALLASAYLDAQSISNIMNQLSARSILPTNTNFSAHPVVFLLDSQKLSRLASLLSWASPAHCYHLQCLLW